MEDTKGVEQSIESLFGADAGEVPDCERVVIGLCRRECARLSIVVGQVDAQWQFVELAGIESEVADHVIAIVVAVDDEPVEVGGSFVNRFDGLAAIRFDEVFEKHVVALQDTQERDIDLFPDRFGGAGQQCVREADQVGLERIGEGVGEFGDLVPMRSVFSLEHIEGECTELSGIGADAKPRGQFQGPGPVDPVGQ